MTGEFETRAASNREKTPTRPGHVEAVTEGDVEDRAARLTGFIFICPSIKVTLGPIMLLTLLVGCFIEPGFEGVLWGVVGGALAVLVSVGCLPWLVRLSGGELYRPHVGLALLFTQGLLLVLLTFGRLADPVWEWTPIPWLAFGMGVIAAFWFLTLRFMATSSIAAWPMALLPPLVQGGLIIAGLEAIDGLGVLILALVLLPFASLGLIIIIDSPFMKALGVRGSILMSHLIAYLGRGRLTMERDMACFATLADLQVGVVAFRRPGQERPFLLMVVPTHHPGPLGELGGSNLPWRLARELEAHTEGVMTLHGASLNDHNPVDSGSVHRLAQAIIRLLPGIELSGTVSRPCQVGEENGCVGQRLGKGTLLLSLPPPALYDDVEPAIGREAQATARSGLEGPALFGDCHTQRSVNAPHLTLENPAATRLLGRVKEVVRNLSESPELPFKAGYGQAGEADLTLGLGPQGVQALMLEVDGERTAYLLFDANGMDPVSWTPLKQALESEAVHLILCTADNHYLNTLRGGHNPLGNGGRWKPLASLARKALTIAIEDLAPAEAGLDLTTVEKEPIFGFGNTVRMASLVNGVAASARVAWLPLFGGASLLYWVIVTRFL